MLAAGAEIDTAGMMDVTLAMESNLIRIARVGNNQLADTPLQKNGFLFGKEIFIDRRLSGERADGTIWYGSPLLDAKGDVQAYGRTIDALLTPGGDISVSGITRADKRSALSVAGGFVRYLGGNVATTKLITADGKYVVDIGSADPEVTYAAFADRTDTTSSKWRRTAIFPTLFANRSATFEPGYLEGSDAGSLTFQGAAVIDATLQAGAVAGPYQRAGSGRLRQRCMPRAGSLDLLGLDGRPAFTISQDGRADAAVRPAPDRPALVGGGLADAGLADIAMGATGSIVTVAAGTDLALPAGGSLTLKGETHRRSGQHHGAQRQGHAVAVGVHRSHHKPRRRAMTVPRRGPASPYRKTSTVDLSGLWVNDAGTNRDSMVGYDFVNGGSLIITDAGYANNSYIRDFATIAFAAGSRINLNSGGYIGANGRYKTDGDRRADRQGRQPRHPAASRQRPAGGRLRCRGCHIGWRQQTRGDFRPAR